MADDLDVEAMLEAPYKEKENYKSGEKRSSDRKRRSRSRSRDRGDSRRDDRDRRDRDRRDRRRSRSRSKDRKRDRDRKRSRSRDRRRSRSKERTGSKKSPLRRGQSPSRSRRERSVPLTPEEKDARTIFCMQLAARIKSRDLEEFFSSVGKVRDVKLITDNKTRRSKGIAYVEFQEVASVTLAMGLNGQKLLGVPIIVQPSQAEKNRAAAGTASMSMMRAPNAGPMRLYVGSLHFNITEEMLKGIFEPFGRIDHINLVQDPETRRSKGFGFVTFRSSEDAMKAMNQLNGFELAGRPMKVGHVTEKQDAMARESMDSEELERHGYDLGATGRIALMAKLAEGTGFEIPRPAQNALDLQMANQIPPAIQAAQQAAAVPAIATQCFLLSNMFDPNSESNPNFDIEIRDDVIEECNKHGGVYHIFVDKASAQGNVYVKCPTIASAVASVTALHGRWFAGKMITAAYVPLQNYHQLFADALKATQLLMPSSRSVM